MIIFALTFPLVKILLLSEDLFMKRYYQGSRQVGCYLAVESLSEPLNTPGHLIHVWDPLCEHKSFVGGLGVSSGMIHVGQLCVCMHMCPWVRACSDWW